MGSIFLALLIALVMVGVNAISPKFWTFAESFCPESWEMTKRYSVACRFSTITMVVLTSLIISLIVSVYDGKLSLFVGFAIYALAYLVQRTHPVVRSLITKRFPNVPVIHVTYGIYVFMLFIIVLII